ncbi:hypothetical protein Pyn_06042 [Prunus yedoensis var. nudiflora]|uniref:Uncharacterized protein n=1 Tax=Prunus yedoensis var. nudiflora TaxID=2094558 RepID=A0A314Z842_PRUYE|nr:hypothetical protein Pyn_06042 [Prunus yedoensis var. nudiflora]
MAAQRWWWSSRVELLKRASIEVQMSSSSIRGECNRRPFRCLPCWAGIGELQKNPSFNEFRR